MADRTYRSRVYRKRGGAELIAATGGSINIDSGTLNVSRATATGGAVNVNAGGAVNFAVGSSHKRAVQTATQGVTLTGSDSGKTVYCRAPTLTHKLPNATGNAGAYYRFVLATGSLAVATGLGIKINPKSGDKIFGIDLSATGNRVLNIVGATDNLGDFIELESDGTSWAIVSAQGTWALTTVT